MKIILLKLFIICFFSFSSFAEDYGYISEEIAIKNAVIRIAKNSANNSAAYFEINNFKNTDIKILQASSYICSKIEIHKSETKDNVTKMIKISNGLIIPKNSKVKFETGSYHLMLIKMKSSFTKDHSVPIELTFENMDPILVNFKIVDTQNMNHNH